MIRKWWRKRKEKREKEEWEFQELWNSARTAVYIHISLKDSVDYETIKVYGSIVPLFGSSSRFPYFISSPISNAERLCRKICKEGVLIGNIYYPPHRIDDVRIVYGGVAKSGVAPDS